MAIYPLNDSDLTEAQRRKWYGEVNAYGREFPSPRRDEFLARLEAASFAVFDDRALCTLPSSVRSRIAVRATAHIMSGKKVMPWTATAEMRERYGLTSAKAVDDFIRHRPMGRRLRAAESRAIEAAEAAYGPIHEAA